MSDLRGRIGRLEQGIDEQSGPARWRTLLAPYFTSPVYDGHRDALLYTLCGAHPAYQFEVEDGSDRGHYYIFWWARSGAPVVMHIQRADEQADEGQG